MTRGEAVRLVAEWDAGDRERRTALLEMLLIGGTGDGAARDALLPDERRLLGLRDD